MCNVLLWLEPIFLTKIYSTIIYMYKNTNSFSYIYVKIEKKSNFCGQRKKSEFFFFKIEDSEKHFHIVKFCITSLLIANRIIRILFFFFSYLFPIIFLLNLKIKLKLKLNFFLLEKDFIYIHMIYNLYIHWFM